MEVYTKDVPKETIKTKTQRYVCRKKVINNKHDGMEIKLSYMLHRVRGDIRQDEAWRYITSRL